MKYTQ